MFFKIFYLKEVSSHEKIIFVSHCILNTASKVVLYNQEEIDAEEALRKKFMYKIIDKEIMVVQLPCPEFTLYGARRWGHVSNQFDNPFSANIVVTYCPQFLIN